MDKKYFVCIYLGRYCELDFYEADKCIVKATDKKTARELAGNNFHVAEEFWQNIEIWEFDEDEVYEA